MRKAILIAGGFALVLIAYVVMTFAQVLKASNDNSYVPASAVVVLGAAQYNGRPSPVLQARLDRAFELHAEGSAPVIVTTGSNQEGDAFTEGFAGYEYLRDRGVPEEALLVITDGASTWEQLAATRRQLVDRNIGTDVILVSDSYHSLRVRQIANEVGLDGDVAPTLTAPTMRQLLRETAAVSVGRIISYRRVDNWLGNVG